MGLQSDEFPGKSILVMVIIHSDIWKDMSVKTIFDIMIITFI